MVGRGSSSGGGGGGGGGTGGLNPNDIISTTSLVSLRESQKAEVDQALRVAYDIQRQYGVNVEDLRVATLKPKAATTMAYYDQGDNLAINKNYFNSARMNKAYDKCVKSGFHPSRGNKTGIEAVTAHEMGHKLTNEVAKKQNLGSWELDKAANGIVKQAAKETGYGNSTRKFAAKISGYGKQSHAEAVAEAFSDVYCNGSKASKESKAVVKVLNGYFGR